MTLDQQAPRDRLGRHATSGVMWLAAQKWVVRTSGFVTLVVLTHHVSPKDFGVVAAAMTVVPMIYLLSDVGFSTYLLQSTDTDRRSLSTAFWTTMAAGAVLSTILWFTAPLMAGAFRSPTLVPVLRALVLAVLPTVLAGVPLALLRRALRFRAVALQSLAAAMVGQVVAVVLALSGGGVWALVAQVVATQWVVAMLAWHGARWRPGWTVSAAKFREMTAFGARVSSVDLSSTGRAWAESWVVTATLGPAAMGLLNVGQRLVLVAQDLTAGSLVPVSTVVFSKVRDSGDRLTTTYLKALGVAYAVVSPLMVVIAVTAPQLIPLLFGSQWGPSVRPAQAMAVAAIITLGAMLDHGLFYGLGRPGTWLAYAVVVDVGTFATTAVAVRWGVAGVAVGFLVVATLATVARWLVVGRLLGMRPATVARPFLTALVPTAGALVVGALVSRWTSTLGSLVLGLALLGAVTLAANLVLLRLTAPHVLRDALGLLPVPDRFTRPVVRALWLRPSTS
ncbi:oligosaccharide flippase family protein [Phycicoccus ginsengisoli]